MNRLDRALGAMFPPADPTPADLERIEEAYRQRISNNGRPRRHRRLIIPAVAAVAVLLTAIGMVALRPSPVQATLTEIAHAARTVDAADLAGGDYYFTESTSTFTQTVNLEDGRQISYTIDEHRRTWISPTGQEAVIQTTRTNPTFETDEDRALYFEFGLDAADRLDTTEASAVDGVSHDALERDWPTEGAELLTTVRALPNVKTDTQAAGQLLDLITESPASPALRAAILEAIGRLNLDLIDRTQDTIHLRTRPLDLDNQIIEFVLDGQGQLRHRTVINHDAATPDADVASFVVDYSPTDVVRGLH